MCALGQVRKAPHGVTGGVEGEGTVDNAVLVEYYTCSAKRSVHTDKQVSQARGDAPLMSVCLRSSTIDALRGTCPVMKVITLLPAATHLQGSG